MPVERGSRSAPLWWRGDKKSIDTRGAFLKTGNVVVRRAPIGYVCAGLGAGGRLLQAAFMDRDLATLLDSAGEATLRSRGINVPVDGIDDAPLRRLAMLMALAKDFDQSQPRDEQGRWTSEGAAGALAARTTISSSSFLGRVPSIVLEAAGTRPIEWYFHEKDVGDYVEELFKDEDVKIKVIYKQMPGQLGAQ